MMNEDGGDQVVQRPELVDSDSGIVPIVPIVASHSHLIWTELNWTEDSEEGPRLITEILSGGPYSV